MKKYLTTLLVTGYFLAFAGITVAYGIYWYHTGSAPEQPVRFEHANHINNVGLTCDYCHHYADEAPNPTIPAVSLCMECHDSVKTGSPEIKRLTEYWEMKEPVPWRNVYYLPDHVYFTHKRHVRFGFDCAECHGYVEGADTMRQVRTLNMGWCVSCHNANKAPVDCTTCHQ